MIQKQLYIVFSEQGEFVAELMTSIHLAPGMNLTLTTKHDQVPSRVEIPGIWKISSNIEALIPRYESEACYKLSARKIGEVPKLKSDSEQFRYIDKWKATPPGHSEPPRPNFDPD